LIPGNDFSVAPTRALGVVGSSPLQTEPPNGRSRETRSARAERNAVPSMDASTSASDDETIIEALRAGRPGAALALYQRLVPFVQRALRRVLRSHSADHDDLIQISFERIIGTIVDGRYRGACSLRGWAMSIATHAALDHLRAFRREQRVLDTDPKLEHDYYCPLSTDAERSLIARSELARLEATLSRMSPMDVRVLMLRDGFGCSLAETAAALGASEAAVASRLARARRELQRRAGHFHEVQ
jgi:RNA polymerase sigma-70 factor, ECF subfamily